MLVETCGVILYINKNLESLSVIVSEPEIWQRACFIVCTALSAKPLEDGWYGTENMCLMPFSQMKA